MCKDQGKGQALYSEKDSENQEGKINIFHGSLYGDEVAFMAVSQKTLAEFFKIDYRIFL